MILTQISLNDKIVLSDNGMRAIMNKLSFVKKPNLPSGNVTSVIISEKYVKFFSELNRLGVSVIVSPPIEEVDGAEKFHADISAIHLGSEKIICAKNNHSLIEKLHSLGFDILMSENNIIGNYPECTALNAVIMDKGIICRRKSVDSAVLKHCRSMLPIINVNQGYSRCSTAIVSENAVITSDMGIYNACIENRIDVLKISNGDIEIEDYKYGFIGGTCGKLSYNILAFCGKIEHHKDYRDMKAFALNYGVNLLSLSNDKLFDVGGILPVLEK